MSSAREPDKKIICSSCHASNAPGARFCNGCGAALSQPGIPASTDANNVAAADVQTERDPLIGHIVEGKYRIDSVIGAGGMGAVYQSTRLLIGDEVAIKILHAERVVDPHASERFRREARAAARLKHPNAVSIYDFGVTSDGLQYLVMELIEGKSLREITRLEGPMNAGLAAAVTSQVCAALDEAHRQDIVHRDIKPDNIILNPSAAGLRVKVLDFGIAKLRDDTASHLTQTGSVMGTPHYMSPEQCLGEELDERADIYSMAVVLYEMLCGRVPFNSPISTAVVVQHVNQPPPPLRTLNPSISPQLDAAVLHGLEKRREARPQSAGAFAREVAAAVVGTAIDYEHQWANAPTRRLPLESADDESTVERLFQSTKSAKEMSPTVHLASLSGSTGLVAQPRATARDGTVSAAVLKQAGNHKYVIVALSAAFLMMVAAVVLWIALRGSANSNAAAKPGDPANVATGNTNGDANRKDSAPPGMTLVRGGAFTMGSGGAFEDQNSKPLHQVTVNPFFIDVHEVTCEEYKKFIDSTARPAPTAWINGNYPAGAARQPVTGVSWEDANAYAHWIGKRLPTEEEWEFAARGPKDLLYPWGNSWKPGCANAGKAGPSTKGMADVGTHDCGSPSGAMDMIGNAWEWTAADWAPYPHGQLRDAPKPGEKVIRGGSWQSPQTVTSTFRAGLVGPADETGFRCAKDSQP
jgi:serine/threonine-protein kinase